MKFGGIDYETQAIENRPVYPPVPVGVALYHGRKKEYLAWGHPAENNISKRDAVRRIKQFHQDYIPVYHNASFDMEVENVHLKIKYPALYEDTLILAYLHDPRDRSLSLKPLADKYLDMPPVEQERLRDWILANIPGIKPTQWGAYIALAPGKLVGTYAVGDVVRTMGLFKLFHKYVKEMDMLTWYEKEKEVIRVKLKMEQGGIRARVPKIKQDLPKFQRAYEEVEKKLFRKLKITKSFQDECPKGVFNMNSPKQMTEALIRSGKMPHADAFVQTDKGNPSVSYQNLKTVLKDKKLLQLMGWHGILSSYIGTFLEDWLRRAELSDGYLYPSFNTVRGTDEYGGKKGLGTKTGRLSSSNPNFQNVPASVKDSQHAALLVPLAKYLKESVDINLIGLRDYLMPDEGCVFIARDYSQQELRILAHYEDAVLLSMYKKDPNMDIHQVVRELVHEARGVIYPRKSIKITNFGLIYGQGADSLAERLEMTTVESRELKKAVLAAIPGVKDLQKELSRIARNDDFIRTYGGRVYYCEEPVNIKGYLKTFEYKMLNLLIQGSAADCTKEAMINVDANCNHMRIVLQVHDELLGCAPIEHEKAEMILMKEGMEDVNFDLPMLTDGKRGKVSWAKMRDCK